MLHPWRALAVPPAVAAATLAARALAGPVAALAVHAAGASAIVGFRLWNRQLVRDRAPSSPEAPVPEGRGSWLGAFTAIHQRVRTRQTHQRDLQEAIDRVRCATGGTGLGLAIVEHVLLRHQAEQRIASEPGRGSTFAMRLPARRVRPEPAQGDAGMAAPAGTSAPGETSSRVRRGRRRPGRSWFPDAPHGLSIR
jgi:hypothetical protein